MRCLVALIALVSTIAGAEPAAKLYEDSCAACHTIGGGDGIGPDLKASTKWAHADLEVAIRRMEDNVGPLTDEQIDGLIAFLKAPQAKPAVVQPKGSPDKGRKLFFGEQKLANGGSPCFACHAVNGVGGNLARDLTSARTTEAIMTNPPIPMMKAAYARYAVTAGEAADLVAFLESTAPKPPASVTPFRVGAVSFAGVMLGAVALVFRSRKAGVRRRLTETSRKR